MEYSPSQYHSCWLCQCLQQTPNCDATACRLSPVSVLVHMDTWELSSRSRSPQGQIQDLKQEGAQGVRGLAPKIFLANLGDFSKYLAQKKVGRAPPCAPPLVPRLLQAIRHELQLTIATQTCQQESSTTKEMITGIPRRLCGYNSPFVNTLRLPHERHLSYHTGVAFAPHNCVIQAWLKANSLKSPPNCLRPK